MLFENAAMHYSCSVMKSSSRKKLWIIPSAKQNFSAMAKTSQKKERKKDSTRDRPSQAPYHQFHASSLPPQKVHALSLLPHILHTHLHPVQLSFTNRICNWLTHVCQLQRLLSSSCLLQQQHIVVWYDEEISTSIFFLLLWNLHVLQRQTRWAEEYML